MDQIPVGSLGLLNDWGCSDEGQILCQIEEGLFLGSYFDANKKHALKRSNVTHILTIADQLRPEFPDDFVYKVVDVLDREDTNIAQHFEECFKFIDDAKTSGGGVLVHCFMGISRSVTIVVAYLMKKRSLNACQALQLVKSRRPQASPNAGFFSQLLLFERSLQGAN